MLRTVFSKCLFHIDSWVRYCTMLPEPGHFEQLGIYQSTICTIPFANSVLVAELGTVWTKWYNYRQNYNISRTFVGNKIVDHSDVDEASLLTSSFSTYQLASMDWTKTTERRDEKYLSFRIWCDLYERIHGIFFWSEDIFRNNWRDHILPESKSTQLYLLYFTGLLFHVHTEFWTELDLY